MKDSTNTDFQKYWSKFEAGLRGQLLQLAKKDVLTNASADLALSGALDFWEGRYAEGRKWLDRVSEEKPEKAELIRTILLDDMSFKTYAHGAAISETTNTLDTALAKVTTKTQLLKYGIPIGSGLSGLVLSNVFGAGTPVAVAACSALLSYPIATNVASATKQALQKDMIDSLLKSLEKYQLSIESVLNND